MIKFRLLKIKVIPDNEDRKCRRDMNLEDDDLDIDNDDGDNDESDSDNGEIEMEC